MERGYGTSGSGSTYGMRVLGVCEPGQKSLMEMLGQKDGPINPESGEATKVQGRPPAVDENNYPTEMPPLMSETEMQRAAAEAVGGQEL